MTSVFNLVVSPVFNLDVSFLFLSFFCFYSNVHFKAELGKMVKDNLGWFFSVFETSKDECTIIDV